MMERMNKKPKGIEYMRMLGKRGGSSTSIKHGKEHYRKTGNLILERYGREHFSELAKKRELNKQIARDILKEIIEE